MDHCFYNAIYTIANLLRDAWKELLASSNLVLILRSCREQIDFRKKKQEHMVTFTICLQNVNGIG